MCNVIAPACLMKGFVPYCTRYCTYEVPVVMMLKQKEKRDSFDKVRPLCKRDSISLGAISKNDFNNVASEMSPLANYVYANC